MSKHNIKILNFFNDEIVSYPIIKLIGVVDLASPCRNDEQIIRLTLKNNNFTFKLIKNTFKFLVELENGKNILNIYFCCESIKFNLDYDHGKLSNTVVPLYVICKGHDGCFQAPKFERNDVESACRRITLCAKLLQCVTAEKLKENNLGRKTFSLESDCQVFKSDMDYLEAQNVSQRHLWETIGREIMNSSIGADSKKYLAFLSCTRYQENKYKESMNSHEDLLGITKGYVALGGGGLALFGTGCLYTWPESFTEVITRFKDSTPVDRAQFLDDSCYRGTLGGCFSTTLGSVLHELYHSFDLGHTESGIMGRGFDNIYKVFTSFHFSSNSRQDILKTFQNKIQFKEVLEPESLLERLQNEKKKKGCIVIKKVEEFDNTFLTKSCAVFLFYHRWFNNKKIERSTKFTIDLSNMLIKSTSGIKVIEIRNQPIEMVLFYWTFEGRILKFSFQIPQDVMPKLKKGSYFIVAEDTNGCILKKTFIV